MCCGCDTSYIVSVHIQCQASIHTLSLCRGHSWRVRLAKQETLTPPGHLVSPLVCRGPWISTVVLYCWCHSDIASVLLYFTLLNTFVPVKTRVERHKSLFNLLLIVVPCTRSSCWFVTCTKHTQNFDLLSKSVKICKFPFQYVCQIKKRSSMQ